MRRVILSVKRFLQILSINVFAIQVMAQSGGQYLNTTAGGGVQTMLYDPKYGEATSSFGGNFNLGYKYFFTEKFGIGTGVGLSYYRSEYIANEKFGYMKIDNINANREYYYQVIMDNWQENQHLLTLEVPIGLYFKTPVSTITSFIIGAGVKLDMPILSKYKVVEGSLETRAYYPDLNVELFDIPHHGYEKTEKRFRGNTDTKIGGSLFLDMGFNHALNNNLALYWGIYINYGFSNISKNNEEFVVSNILDYNSIINSTIVDNTNLFATGIKIGLTLPLKSSRVINEGLFIREEELQSEALIVDTLPLIVENIEEIEEAIKSLKDWNNFKPEHRDGMKEVLDKYNSLSDEGKGKVDDKLKTKLEVLNTKVEETTEKGFIDLLGRQNICNFNMKRSSSIFSEEKTSYIIKVIECLKMNPDKKILIVGHTCNVGTTKNNLKLGAQRAAFVKNYMIRLGASPSQLSVATKGESVPAAPNDSEANRRLNRRVTIEVIDKIKKK